MKLRNLAVLAFAVNVVAGCKEAPLPPPDPDGKDMVDGAIVAAEEKSGGMRLYKIIHVDQYPAPAGAEYHMIAFDPKVNTFDDARSLWRQHGTKVALDHMLVRWVSFKPREHRIITVEPVTQEELAPYKKAQR